MIKKLLLHEFHSELLVSWLKGKKKKRCLARNQKIIETRQLNLNQNTEVTVAFFLFAERLTKTSVTAALSSLKCIKCVVFMVTSLTG